MRTNHIIIDYAAAIDRRDWEALADCFTADAVIRFPDGLTLDADAYVDHLQSLHGSREFTVLDIVSEGERAALQATISTEAATRYFAGFFTIADGLISRLDEVLA